MNADSRKILIEIRIIIHVLFERVDKYDRYILHILYDSNYVINCIVVFKRAFVTENWIRPTYYYILVFFPLLILTPKNRPITAHFIVIYI